MKHHLSYNILKEANGLDTLKFQRQLQGVMVQTNSSGQQRVTNLSNLHCSFFEVIELAPQFKVLVRNDNTMNKKGYVKDIQVKIQNYVLYLSIFLLCIILIYFFLIYSWNRFSPGSFLVGNVGTTCCRFQQPYIEVLHRW